MISLEERPAVNKRIYNDASIISLSPIRRSARQASTSKKSYGRLSLSHGQICYGKQQDSPDSMTQPQRIPASSSQDEPVLVGLKDKESSTVLTLPTILTLSRVAAIPALITVWFSSSSSRAPFLTAGLFLAACLTDFLDGYLARKMGTHSPFGAFLDPVADKLMVSTVLILLSSRPFMAGSFAGNSWLMPTIASAIIGREIAMSALREWAASLGPEAHKAVAVSSLGKWKTTTQMTSLTLLLVSSGGASGKGYLESCATVGVVLLLVAAFLTLFSLYQYLRGLWQYLV